MSTLSCPHGDGNPVALCVAATVPVPIPPSVPVRGGDLGEWL